MNLCLFQAEELARELKAFLTSRPSASATSRSATLVSPTAGAASCLLPFPPTLSRWKRCWTCNNKPETAAEDLLSGAMVVDGDLAKPQEEESHALRWSKN